MQLLRYFLILGLALQLSGCAKSVDEQAKQLMGALYKSPLKIPKDLVLLNPGTIKNENQIDLTNDQFTQFYVVHYFEADCDKCINELRKAQEFILKDKELPNTKFIFIADSPTAIFAKNAISKLSFQFPVYYEKDYAKYKKINSFPLGNSLYNTVLLNSKHQLLLMGSLFNNEKAEALYKEIINQKNN